MHDDREKLFGPTHPKVASVLGAFADIELLRCHLTQAKEFIDLAQDINGKFFGQNHPTTLTYATTRAKVECAAGEYKNALERVTDALRRRKALYPDVHPTIAECFFVAAECTRELGNTKAAQKYYEEALAIRTKLFPTAHAAVAEAKMALAVNAVARCTYLPALPLLQVRPQRPVHPRPGPITVPSCRAAWSLYPTPPPFPFHAPASCVPF